MERLRPRTIIRLLSFSCILWMALAPLGARAAGNWDGPAVTQLGGTPSLLADTVITPLSQSNQAVPATQDIAAAGTASHAHPATTTSANPAGGTGVAAHGKNTGGVSQPAGSGSTKPVSTSPALNLPAYSPVSASGGGQALDGGSIAALVIKFLVVLALLFIVLRVLKAIMPRTRGARGAPDKALLLHSESIGDKQRILLLDMGAKLVAVGVSGAGMSTLATIEEMDAVDAIRARYAPLADAVPGYREGSARPPLSRSFMETLKRTGLAMQRQAAETPAGPANVSRPFLKHVGGAKAGDYVDNPPTRAAAGSGRRIPRQLDEPILHEALEAMRAVRRKVESS
ncbi:MAG: hypothetical protein ACRDG4_11055 [Chloroflexota bacterium]